MIDYALSGKTVVRLKGGDPYVYGRGAEELDACIAAGLEAEVIPGITSAIAVPARAAIPVTLRKVSSIFTVISGHSGLSETKCRLLRRPARPGHRGAADGRSYPARYGGVSALSWD